jgi:hypothetical protein
VGIPHSRRCSHRRDVIAARISGTCSKVPSERSQIRQSDAIAGLGVVIRMQSACTIRAYRDLLAHRKTPGRLPRVLAIQSQDRTGPSSCVTASLGVPHASKRRRPARDSRPARPYQSLDDHALHPSDRGRYQASSREMPSPRTQLRHIVIASLVTVRVVKFGAKGYSTKLTRLKGLPSRYLASELKQTHTVPSEDQSNTTLTVYVLGKCLTLIYEARRFPVLSCGGTNRLSFGADGCFPHWART